MESWSHGDWGISCGLGFVGFDLWWFIKLFGLGLNSYKEYIKNLNRDCYIKSFSSQLYRWVNSILKLIS